MRKDNGHFLHKAKLASIMSVQNITYLQGTTWVSIPDKEHQMMEDVLCSETPDNDACQILLKNSLKADRKTFS